MNPQETQRYLMQTLNVNEQVAALLLEGRHKAAFQAYIESLGDLEASEWMTLIWTISLARRYERVQRRFRTLKGTLKGETQ